MLLIPIWESKESMEALREHTPQGGPLGVVTNRDDLFDEVEKYQGLTAYSPECVKG
jgi:hypothetical protein